MRILHEGRGYAFHTAHEWLAKRHEADSFRRQWLDEIVTQGVITDDDGQPMPEPEQGWMKARLTGAHEGLPSAREQVLSWRKRAAGERRWLIPGLWGWGTVPALAGNPKAGKSRLVTGELVPALVVPGFRFLDHFDPAAISPAELARGIWVINAETPAEDFDAAMKWLWDEPVVVEVGSGEQVALTAADLVSVWHLEEHGGPTAFDLTDPAKYGQWGDLLGDCEDCDGTDFWTPFAVIVDGLTAILGGSTGRYPEWYAAFKALMRSYDVPNALYVGHSTLAGNRMMGGTESLGGPDGLWLYASDNPDSPSSARRFWTLPRMGGIAVPPTRVGLAEDGRLRVDRDPSSTDAASGVAPVDEAAEVADVAERTAAYVREHPGAHGQELTENVASSSKGRNLEGRAKAVQDGLIRERECLADCALCERPHHRRRHYWPPPD